MCKKSARKIYADGLCASAAPLYFAAIAAAKKSLPPVLFVLNDQDEAGYFYHDMAQMIGEENVLFFPSSYKRAIKYNQKDAANAILRTEVLSRLSEHSGSSRPLYVVSYPEALAEKVMSKKELTDNMHSLSVGAVVDVTALENRLFELGFHRTDYVYEPGQFAIRGSIVDIYSFTSELPYRIDFFGDDVDSIRTFDVQSQLSKDKVETVCIVPEIESDDSGFIPFTEFIPDNMVLAVSNLAFVFDRVSSVYEEGFSTQAIAEEKAILESDQLAEAEKMRQNIIVSGEEFARDILNMRRVEFGTIHTEQPTVTVKFETSPQPLFHKNFELVTLELGRLIADGYKINILADSEKQITRLKDIFDEIAHNDSTAVPEQLHSGKGGITFEPVNKAIHAGFTDHTLRRCFFTDHQIFDRFHKYNLKSEKARKGKVALTLKEISQFEIGDYVVHIDHGVGRFGGLVRVPNNGVMQEMIKITYQNEDTVYVSIHSLHKVSKYKGKEGEPPRMNRLGTGAWERMKERVKTKVKDIARDLIRLYAQRKQEKGFAFTADG